MITLDQLRQDALKCTKCKLCETRTKVVFGEGNLQAKLMICGESPGKSENESGRPFVGRSGRLLISMIEAAGLKREDVYILNTVCCQPPNNRVPTDLELETCRDYLVGQISEIRPNCILALGATAIKALTGSNASVSTMRGNIFLFLDSKIQVVPTYHPSYLLRNPSMKQGSPRYLAWKDLNKAIKIASGLINKVSFDVHV